MTVRGVLLLRSELWGVRREGDRGWGLKGVLGEATDATGVRSLPSAPRAHSFQPPNLSTGTAECIFAKSLSLDHVV